MTNKKDIVIAVLLTFCLTATLFMIIPTRSQSNTTSTTNYDPWVDVNDDGFIDIFDIVYIATTAFGTSGTPINKTALLLELMARLESLNASLIELESRVASLEKRVPQKGRISVSPSAFSPTTNGQSFRIVAGSTLEGQGEFDAALQLPNGARITNMTVVLVDMKNDGNVVVGLMGYNITKDNFLTIPMAMVGTTNSEMPGQLVLYDDTISDNVVNNNCVYWPMCSISYNDPLLRITAIMLDYEYLS